MMQTTFNLERLRTVPLHHLVGNNNITRKIKIKCPFHQERTGSCQLSPRGGWKCFGCGTHGNSIDFVIKMGGTFEEAVEELSKYI